MFYSHEILTSRKHGVATVWLVATLGSKSSLKKVSRKAILDVDVSKACETIANPESPMALRLQSSLLYGVSRVFSQQCGYILTDSQALNDKMRGISMVMRDLQVDTSLAATSSSNQLNLPIDPSFDFEINLDIDLSTFDLPSTGTEKSSLLSPYTLASSQSSMLPPDEFALQPELPAIDVPAADFFTLDFATDRPSSLRQNPAEYVVPEPEEPGIDAFPLFEIADDGSIIDTSQNHNGLVYTAGSGTLQSLQAYRENEKRVQGEYITLANVQDLPDNDFNDGHVFLGDDDGVIPSIAQPITSTPANVDSSTRNRMLAGLALDSQPEREETEVTAEAPQLRTRSTRTLHADQVTELSNRQLSEWHNTYIDAMTRSKYARLNKQSLAQAKQNAAFWMFDQGIGGVMINFGDDREVHPLSTFSGSALLEALTGTQASAVGRKRSHSLTETGQGDVYGRKRTARSSTEANVVDRNHQILPIDDDDGMLFHEDDEVEIQMGRQPASSLKDQPSSMPWNIMGSSRQGSLQGSAHPSINPSVGRIGLDLGPPSLLSARRARLTSASPLVGRGKPPSRLASLDAQLHNESFNLDTEDFSDPHINFTGGFDENFELYGPAAVASTQQVARNSWLADTLENEAHNFFIFLDEQISTKLSGKSTVPSITFASLLPPEQNSNIVAAQGLLHVLALATKGIIDVKQEEAFGDITLRVVTDGNER